MICKLITDLQITVITTKNLTERRLSIDTEKNEMAQPTVVRKFSLTDAVKKGSMWVAVVRKRIIHIANSSSSNQLIAYLGADLMKTGTKQLSSSILDDES